MYITRHSNVTNRDLLESLFALYEQAYSKIAEEDITREVLYRHEFDEVMADPTYRTTVVRDDDGEPVAMSVIATDIGVTKYLSRPYFQRRYPERLAEGRIHYVMWAVVHPEHQGSRAVFDLIRAGLQPEASDGTLLVFDLPESNQPNESGGGAELIYRAARSFAEVELESFGMSRYYALDFAPSEAQVAERDGVEAEQLTT